MAVTAPRLTEANLGCAVEFCLLIQMADDCNLGLSVSFLSPRVDECVQLIKWCKVNTKIQDSLTVKALSAVGQMTLNTSYESGDNKRHTCRNALNSNGRKRVGKVMKWCSGELSCTYCSINRMVFKEVLLHSNAPGKHQSALG